MGFSAKWNFLKTIHLEFLFPLGSTTIIGSLIWAMKIYVQPLGFVTMELLGLSVNLRALEIKELWMKLLEIYL